MIEKEYLTSRISSSNEAQLVAIVYEGLIDALQEAKSNIDSGNIQALNASTNKARDIVAELMATLQGDSEIAMNYRSLYIYVNNLLTQSEIQKSADKLEEAISVIMPLQEGWKELGEKMFNERVQSGAPTPPPAGMTYSNGYISHSSSSEKEWEKG